jgi:HK97 family phage major capsid protein
MYLKLLKEWKNQPAGATIDVPEEYAPLLTEPRIAEPVAGDPVENRVAQALQAAGTRWTKSLDQIIDMALQKVQEAQSQAMRHARPALFGPRGDGDPKHSFGDWLLAVRRNDGRYLADQYGSHFADWDNAGHKAALNTQTGAQGGYTVPAEFLPRLVDLVAENSVVRPRATVIPMASKSIQVPVLDVTTAPVAGDTAFLGGLVARWTEEAAGLTESEPAFKQIDLTAHELSGYTKVSNALLADNAVGLEALLLNLFGRAIGWYEDQAFLRGNGVGKPFGVLNSGALISVTRSGASAFALADAAAMLARLLPGYDPRTTVWAIHPSVLSKLITMSSTAGNVVWIDNARQRPQMVLFGIPVAVSEKLPSLNTLGDVLLLDLRHYLVGDRQQIEIAYSEHVAFLNNQGVWRFVARLDGQPWLRSAVTLSDASTTLSPFVGLAPG